MRFFIREALPACAIRRENGLVSYITLAKIELETKNSSNRLALVAACQAGRGPHCS